jgi:hypothetical protein
MVKAKTDSPFVPVGKKDTLQTVRVYKRTADPHDQQAIVVCVYKRAMTDVQRAAGHSVSVDLEYVKIGVAPWSYHTDARGALIIMVGSWGGSGHWRAWQKLGISQIRVSSWSQDHGSENSKRLGIYGQYLTVRLKDGSELPDHRWSHTSHHWETSDSWSCGSDNLVFYVASDYRWGDMPIVWVDGLTRDAIVADQRKANEEIAERETARERRALAPIAAE